MRSLRACLLAALCSTAGVNTAGLAYAQPAAPDMAALPTLSLDDAVQAALARHPDLAALRHALDAAQSVQAADVAYAAPELKLSTTHDIPNAKDKGNPSRQSLGVQWDVPQPGTVALRRAGWAETAAASRWDLLRARHELVQRVRDSYQALLAYPQEDRHAEAAVSLRQQALEAVTRQVKLGRATALDDVDAQARWHEARLQRDKLQEERNRAQSQLDALLGLATSGRQFTDEQTFDSLVDKPLPTVETALAGRADLRAAEARCKSNQFNDQQRAAQDDWGVKNIELTYQPATSARTATAAVQLVIGLPVPGRSGATVNANQSSHQACLARLRSMQELAQRDLNGLQAQWAAQREAYKRYSTELTPLAAERVRLSKLSVRQNLMPSADLLLAKATEAQARQQAIGQLRLLRSTVLAIELAAGIGNNWVWLEP